MNQQSKSTLQAADASPHDVIQEYWITRTCPLTGASRPIRGPFAMRADAVREKRVDEGIRFTESAA